MVDPTKTMSMEASGEAEDQTEPVGEEVAAEDTPAVPVDPAPIPVVVEAVPLTQEPIRPTSKEPTTVMAMFLLNSLALNKL